MTEQTEENENALLEAAVEYGRKLAAERDFMLSPTTLAEAWLAGYTRGAEDMAELSNASINRIFGASLGVSKQERVA